MKLLTLLICLPLMTQAQEKNWKKITKNDILIGSMQFVAGSADGLNQVISHHPHTFSRYFPNADMTWWDPRKSQHRKNNTWVVISDGFHVTRGIEHTFNYGSIAISTGDLFSYKKKDRWKVIAKKFLISYITNRIGFNLIYKYAFNDNVERRSAGLDTD